MLNAARSAAVPVNQRRFERLVTSIWQNNGHGSKLGLAVSGGVDSMALASLCSKIKGTRETRPSFAALIVDHGVRKGSTDEAQRVAHMLEDIGLEARVLTLKWAMPHPGKLPDFETKARQMRFRALGRACRDMRINTLMLAHHADDQAETVLYRLSAGYGGSGLKGIQSEALVPECRGLYGVCESGRPSIVLAHDLDTNKTRHISIEGGGVTIHRPLLDVHKAQLMATCIQNQLPWVEDETNTDSTLTPRNAIRHICQNFRLPSALAVDKLLDVSSVHTRREQERTAFSEQCVNLCRIQLDVRSGSAKVLIPAEVGFLLAGGDVQENRHRAALFLRRLITLSRPKVFTPTQDLNRAVLLMFPYLRLDADNILGDGSDPVSLSGIILHNVRQDQDPNTSSEGIAAPQRPCCQAVACNVVRSVPVTQQKKLARIVILQPTPQRSPSVDYTWSDWVLFDGRFWIRIRYRPFNLTPGTSIQVRFLDVADLEKLHRDVRHARNLKRLELVLKRHAPDRLRFTLPVIVQAQAATLEGESEKDGEKIMALPSMSWSDRGWQEWMHEEEQPAMESEGWKYQIRYKKVDFGKGDGHKFVV